VEKWIVLTTGKRQMLHTLVTITAKLCDIMRT